MNTTALQRAQHEADDLALQLELLASTAEIYSHAGTPEAVCYGLNWIHSILQNDILRYLSLYIEDLEETIDSIRRERLGGTDKAGKELP